MGWGSACCYVVCRELITSEPHLLIHHLPPPPSPPPHPHTPSPTTHAQVLAEVCALCNDARIEFKAGHHKSVGQPTEAALLVLAIGVSRGLRRRIALPHRPLLRWRRPVFPAA